MKIAILLPGQPRFTGDFKTLLRNLKGYHQADWFVYLTNSPTREEARVKDHTIPIHSEWINYNIAWAESKIIQNLPPNHFLKKFEISDVHVQKFPQVRAENYQGIVTDNIFNMYYNLYKVNQLRVQYEQENNFKYDAVIRARSDVGLPNEVNINDYDLSASVVIMPDERWYGSPPANDQFGFGNSDAMSIYSGTMPCLEEYVKQVADFGPEALLGHHLNSNKVSYIRGGFANSLRSLPLDPDWI
jgi:hypothetical protein